MIFTRIIFNLGRNDSMIPRRGMRMLVAIDRLYQNSFLGVTHGNENFTTFTAFIAFARIYEAII